MEKFNVISLVTSTLRLATPLIFASIGGVFCEKSGVVNIALEGMMVIGAFFAVLGSSINNSGVAGVIYAMIGGGLLALIHAFLSINLKADQIISGTAINLFAAALSSFLIMKFFNTGGQTNIVTPLPYDIPKIFLKIPILGEILKEINWFVVIAIIIAIAGNYILKKTTIGLRIRAVGEHPKAADTLGVNVHKARYMCVILSGILAGLGGASLSIGITPMYREGIVAGRGFIALAAMIFGNWNPIGAMFASLLFAFASSLQIVVQGLGWSLQSEVYSAFPYVVTMIVLSGFVGKTTPPAASGKPY